ncbi:hypothetical protein RhiJN_12902 [Ceratobasidium sp. AG-Ba]|nr:hypothetical protein RhiJN_12902 [Ceratobasidium sp. AG-Ba]
MSFVDSILSSAPAGSNPYTYAAEFVATIIPPKPGWYFDNIIAAGIVAAINLISTIACFIVMWRRSRAGTGVGLWFFRTRLEMRSLTDLIDTNPLQWCAIHHAQRSDHVLALESGVHVVDAALHLAQLLCLLFPESPTYQPHVFWYGFVFIWDATGMWTSAFGTLYATLLPKLFTVTPADQSHFKSLLLHPITLNIFCFLPPVGLAITQIVTSTYSAIAWSDLVYTQFRLIDILNNLAKTWDTNGEKVFHMTCQIAFQKNAWTCGSWYLLCMVLFTPTAVWLLWVIRDAMAQRTRRPTPHLPPPQAVCPFSNRIRRRSPSGGNATWSSNSRAGNTQADDTLRQLRRALYTASLQFAATFFCLGLAAGSWLWIAADAGRLIVNPTLHALAILLTIWVYVIVGCLVNLFILIRTRREDDSPASSGGNAMPLSAIKASHVSSHARSESERERDQKPMYIMAHTTTHVMVDDPKHRSSGSEHEVELGLGSAYSLNSTPMEGADAKEKGLGNGEEWPRG